MKRTVRGLLIAALLSVIEAAPKALSEESSLRLPTTSVPTRYDLKLSFSVVGPRTVTGTVKITIDIKENTDTITLHNRGLTVSSVKLYKNSTDVIEQTFSFEPEKDFMHIVASRELLMNEILYLEISFTGQLKSNSLGIYRSTYKYNNATRSLIATQLGMKEARTAFVCYDEPGFKAVFALILEHEAAYTSISNEVQIVRLSAPNNRATFLFRDSPKMSPYLLAFVTSAYEFNSNEAAMSRTLQRVYTRPDAVGSTRFALENADHFLKEMENFVSVQYELSKIYHVTVPDFYYSGMENWGLITYKENVLIGDTDSHHSDVLRILQVVAHEIAHQFFGNLVTCKYLDAMWLNEGFATYFEHKLVEIVHPELRSMDFFNVQKLQNAFQVDALESTHPLTYDGETLRELVYDKPGSVIRMFANAVGEDTFRRALVNYLTDNNHGAVVSENLYSAFEEAIHETSLLSINITEAFANWETTKGFPLVTVKTDAGTNSFHITQERYYAATEERVAGDTRSWYIPLSYATANNPNFDDTTFTDWFPNGEALKTIAFPTGFDESQWYIFNKQQIGVYRVNYDIDNWYRLILLLNSDNFEQIHVLNRAQLVDDALNLAMDGYLEYNIAFGVLQYLRREIDYIPWRAAVANLDKLDVLLRNQPAAQSFRKFVRYLNRRMFVVSGIEDQTEDLLLTKFSRELAVDLTCRMNDEKCLTKTSEFLRLIVYDNVSVAASTETSFICNGLRKSNRSVEFETIFNKMQSSNDQAQRIRLINGLMCSSDPILIYEFLSGILASSTLNNYRLHERQRILNNIFIKSEVGLTATIDFISNFYDEIVATFSTSAVESLLIELSKRIVAVEEQSKLGALIAKLERNITSIARERASQNLKTNQAWIANRYAEVDFFLNDFTVKLDEVENQLRLPRTSLPQYYKIHIDASTIHTGDRAYSGEVEIDILILEETDHVILHSRNQIILDVKVYDKLTSEELLVLDHHLFPAADTLTIYFFTELPRNMEITVAIKYSTTMTTYEAGFYQTSYTMNNQTRFLGATQFQGTDARFVFPHFEEPHFKAVFELKITHNDFYTAISNMPETIVNNGDGTSTSSFDPTPPMSSYLLAFVVSDLQSISNALNKPEADVLQRVWVRPDSITKAQYALDNSINALKALEDYVGFPYELPKVDSAGIPNKSGAMENWGMLTYRENAMIYEEDPDDISHVVKLSGINVISHELAHQFFGDSVTCEWWDYIWLNEGFATMFEFYLTGLLYPDWNTRHFFNIRKLHNSFREDAKEAAKSMTKNVSSPQEILDAFDFVVYDKAGSVLRMFQNAVGENIFRASLKRYLETNNHKSVTSQDLFDAFNAEMVAAGNTAFNFDTAFRTWERQAGFPLITVGVTPSGQFNVTHQRFFTQKATSTDTSSWYIPLNYATASNANFEDTSITNYFVNGDSSYIFIAPQFDSSQWFIFNKQQLGYYRVNYDAANWQALISVLNSDNFNQIHVLNRVQLVDDSITLAAGGYLDYDTVFGILTYLVRETEYTPFFSADRFISTLYTTFGPFNDDLNTLVLMLSDKFYQTHRVTTTDYSIPAEGVYARYNRDLSFKLACNAGNQLCLQDTYKQVHNFVDNQIKIPNGMESSILCSGLRGTGKQQDWVAMWNRMTASTDAIFKTHAMKALGCTDDPFLLKEYLESTVVPNAGVQYSLDERKAVFSAVLTMSHSGLEAVISFLNDYQLDILWNFGYDNLEPVLTEMAKTVKSNIQETLFNDYLSSLFLLDAEVLARVTSIVAGNFDLQQMSVNVEIMGIIQRILRPGEETTTNVGSSESTPTTSRPGTTQTASITTTQEAVLSSTSTSTQITSTSIPSPTFNQDTTIISSTAITSNATTTPSPSNSISPPIDTSTQLAVDPTTLGGQSNSIKLLTLITGICLSFILY